MIDLDYPYEHIYREGTDFIKFYQLHQFLQIFKRNINT